MGFATVKFGKKLSKQIFFTLLHRAKVKMSDAFMVIKHAHLMKCMKPIDIV